jgi:hypothetical protein
MGCACNKKPQEKIEQKKEYKKENFNNLNEFFSKNWIYIIITLIIIIMILFYCNKKFFIKQ